MCNSSQGLVLDLNDVKNQEDPGRMMALSALAASRKALARADMTSAKETAARLQDIVHPVENDNDDVNDADSDDDGASQVGDKTGCSLSALGVITKQVIAERHCEGNTKLSSLTV